MSEYVKKVAGIIHSSVVGTVLSLSRESGILQVLLDADQPLTSHEIADRKNLKERYVKEILNCLATSEIIQASWTGAGELVYHLDESQRQAFRDLLLPLSVWPRMVSANYDQVKEILAKDGPSGARHPSSVQDYLEELSLVKMDMYMGSVLLHVDGLQQKLESGIDVIEFGCGRGRVLHKYAETFPKSNFTFSDNIPDLLDQVRNNLGDVPNIKYEVLDLCFVPDPPTKKYDFAYCLNVVHDTPYPGETLKTIRKLVREPDGVFVMIEVGTSGNPIDDRGKLDVAFLFGASAFFCVPESCLQLEQLNRQKEDDWRQEKQTLGLCWGTQTAVDLATAAGFLVQAVELEMNWVLFICRPDVRLGKP